MGSFTRDDLSALLAEHEQPCVTLCMPTHRRLPEAEQNSIRFKNLLKKVATTLEEERGSRDAVARAIVEKLEALGVEPHAKGGPGDFWNHQQDGLAVFVSPDHFSHHSVPLALRDITVVADAFHVKPLLPLLYEDTRYHVLGLTQNQVTIFEGSRDGVTELPVNGVPVSLKAALGSEWDDSRGSLRFHGKSGSAGEHFHGSGGSDREDEHDLERFLRAVDRAVESHVSKPSRRPLILAAVERHHSLFRSVSKNPYLVGDGIPHDPKSLSPDELREAAWAIFEPVRAGRVRDAVEEHGSAAAKGQGSNDLAEVARAAVAGRVKQLVLEEQRRVWGRLDRETGAVEFEQEEGAAGATDLLAGLAELTLTHSGDVLLAPAEEMPTDSGVAATYRF